MRRRRAQRCLLRAEVALEAGFIADARAALDEARQLHAPPEEIARIEALIPEREAAALAETRRLGWKPIAAAAIIGLAASIFGFGALWRETPAAAPAGQTVAATSPTSTPADTMQNVPVRVDDVLAVPTVGVVGEPAIPPASESSTVSDAALVDAPSADAAAAERDDAASSRVPTPPALGLSTTSTLPVPRATIPPPPAVPAPSIDAPRDASVAAARGLPPVDPVPALVTAPPPRDESVDVRAVLARYESAYSQLNPSAARAVWPTVDERALSRAFSGLASQQLSLGRCDVALSGVTARATCVGTATWTPKVGGGNSRTEARRWTFDLRKSGDEWRIERATTR